MDFQVAGRTVSLYPGKRKDSPLIILNSVSDRGSSVAEAVGKMGCDCSLASVSGLNWNQDMTPWLCPPLSRTEPPFTGGAEQYLEALTSQILPETRRKLPGEPAFIGIAAYSLAGLFALFSMYHTEVFSRAASMSGSLWFPDFSSYAVSTEMKKKPDRIYLSVGDKEDQTRNVLLRSVRKNTESLAAHYRAMGIRTELELSEGNHFRDAVLRSAKGIAALVKE